MDRYIGTKIVLAEPMDECTFLTSIKGEDVKNRETRAGYLVIYEDNYRSWSPKETFERAYRPLTGREISLVLGYDGVPTGKPVLKEREG